MMARTTTAGLRWGDHGDEVRALQEDLMWAGHDVGSGGADGVFGAGTYRAVVMWQTVHDLRADGMVGAATWAAMDRVRGRRVADRGKAAGPRVVCDHAGAVPVETVGTVLDPPELVAWLCPGCDTQLPATWNCLLPG
ncbi:peptidoglycan-binding domain-containing protein [Nocardiopsis sp. CT-R113]|uniref:Peptidoglycan-binding domain-containing protein n=1 Tax=Nocardiopsis codii TaxID=3065942 RepID=A0ABU7KDB6_9ACTN|nr:peptidoglycan-binding domain-containing protein [Nocardiopsis sp. CT-R113]MEE2040225.1 peptidoglycan-binding domain-containing protein [Nocardiopsis sp. CT-R113]